MPVDHRYLVPFAATKKSLEDRTSMRFVRASKRKEKARCVCVCETHLLNIPALGKNCPLLMSCP